VQEEEVTTEIIPLPASERASSNKHDHSGSVMRHNKNAKTHFFVNKLGGVQTVDENAVLAPNYGLVKQDGKASRPASLDQAGPTIAKSTRTNARSF